MKILKTTETIAVLLAVLLLLAGCRGGSTGGPGGEGGKQEDHGGEGEVEPIARTEFSGKLLNFFEFAPLKPQQMSSFLIHLTELDSGEPVAQADVKLIIKGANGQEIDTVQAKVGRVTGIYVAEVTIPTAGTYGIDFVVKNDKLQDTMPLKGFEVSNEQATAESEEEAPSETVAFLMEQQWMIDMKLAQAEAKELAVPIHSTGRIIPAANNHARLSSPVGGTLSGQNLPLVGTRVYQEQPVATVIETATASEMAQVRASLAQVEAARVQTSAQLQSENANIRNQNAQAQIENARLQAEKKALAEQLEVAQARLNQAKKETTSGRHFSSGASGFRIGRDRSPG